MSVKNIYLYGASDDLGELESDFGVSAEVSPSIGVKVNDMHFKYVFDGDWGVYLDSGDLPEGWKLHTIHGNTAIACRRKENAGMVIHLQIPKESDVSVYESHEDDEPRTVWKKV